MSSNACQKVDTPEMCPACPAANPYNRSFLAPTPEGKITASEKVEPGQAFIDVNAHGHGEVIAHPDDIKNPNILLRLYSHTIGRLGGRAVSPVCCIGGAELPSYVSRP